MHAERQSDIAAMPETISGKYFRLIESSFIARAISGRIIRIAQVAKLSETFRRAKCSTICSEIAEHIFSQAV
jgi:hypothetical protein